MEESMYNLVWETILTFAWRNYGQISHYSLSLDQDMNPRHTAHKATAWGLSLSSDQVFI